MDRYFAMVYLTEANEHRDAWQELQRALKSYRGEGLPQDQALARETFDRVHRLGKAFSAFCLAFMQEHGLGVARSAEEARRHYVQAAETFEEEGKRGMPASLNNLGFMYAHGTGVTRDPAKAVEHFLQAGAAGFSVAKVNLGLCHLNGFGVDKDEVAAFMLFKEAADLGDGAGAACIGQMLRDGIAVAADAEQAFKYLHQAAEAGDALAWLELGMSYDLGLGVDVDKGEAEKWYTLASADGSAEAQARLASILASAGHNEIDFKKALTLLDFASDQGNDFADYYRGVLDLYGGRWRKANPMSARLIAMALRDRGSVHGLRLLGKIYDHGGGVGRDPKQAANWFRQAAMSGDADSQAEMGIRCERADGVGRDIAEAYAWFLLAASVRSTEATRSLDRLRPQLSLEELTRAESLAVQRRVSPRLMRELQLDEK